MIKVGITGQSGFLGTHLFNTLGLFPNEFERISFSDDYFTQPNELVSFISKCDVIVHLAAMNRHNDPEVIYSTNTGLVKTLITALAEAGNKPHILISSSVQEDRDNLYGRSKKEGRELLADHAQKTGCPFTGFVFPNIFGPFGHPYYNSFIATFSHQLTHGETPNIEVDACVPLLYVNEAVQIFLSAIREKTTGDMIRVAHTSEYKVTAILEMLKHYRDTYYIYGIIPTLKDPFEISLFNTFRGYIDQRNFFPFALKKNSDNRGVYVETIKTGNGGQFSFSTTLPGITRGNHYHTRKVERFAVIRGNAVIRMRRIGNGEVLEFTLSGDDPSFVDMPVWYTHNITNTGPDELYTLFWINEFYNPDDPDTYYEEVIPQCLTE